MDLWYPQATRDVLADAGGFIAGPYRGVLHTTEGRTYEGARAAYVKNRSAPHFTATFEGGVFRVFQHMRIDRAARALRNQPGGVQTNLRSAIQIELVATADPRRDWPAELHAASLPQNYLEGIRNLMRWIEAQTGIKRRAPAFLAYPASYGATSARMSAREWNAFDAWCGHQHVPENDHGDPGLLDISFLVSGDPPPRPPQEGTIVVNRPPIAVLTHPSWGAGYIVITDDGGVFAFGGAPFFGSTGNVQLNARIIDAQPTASGQGYVLMGADGGMFMFGDAQFAGRVEYAG